MKQIIDRYEIFKVNPRWVFLKIITKDGIVGFGEPTIKEMVNNREGMGL